eukprot:3516911-Prorocentrum_lima.AAC.1
MDASGTPSVKLMSVHRALLAKFTFNATMPRQRRAQKAIDNAFLKLGTDNDAPGAESREGPTHALA